MDPLQYWIMGFLIVAFGTAMGSFANVLAVRMREASSVWGRSRCVHCRQTLRPRHLVPVVSWLILHGRCAFCHKPIHWQYPLMEFAGALLSVAAYVRHPFFDDPSVWPAFLFETLFAVDLLVLVAFDLRWKLLPIEFIIGSTVVFAAWNAWMSGRSPSSVFIGLAVGAGFLGLQVLLSRGRWMGAGDPWLGGLIGAVLGWPGIAISLYLTYVTGGFVAVFLLLTGAAKRGRRIPFAPFLAAGAILTLWFGPWIEAWIASKL